MGQNKGSFSISGRRRSLKSGKYLKPVFTVFLSIVSLSVIAIAGSLTPPSAPASTFHTLEEIYNSIAGTFNSSSITSSTTGSLIQGIKYINSNLAWASSSNNIWSLNTGNVGIGTTAPSTKLEVQGTASASYLLTGNTLQVGGYSSAAYSRFGTNTTSYSTILSAANDLLISGDLEVDGKTYFDGTANFAGIASASLFYAGNGTAASPSFSFRADQDTGMYRKDANSVSISAGSLERLNLTSTTASISNALYVNSTGKVGIGTTTPGEKLDVVGNIQNITNTDAPLTRAGALELPSGDAYTYDIAVSGRYAYITTYLDPARVIVVDVSKPSSPTKIGSVTLDTGENYSHGIATAGRYVYVTGWGSPGKLITVDISNPASPTRVGAVTLDTGENNPYSVAVAGRYAYVSTYTSPAKIIVIDISNPASPTRVGAVTLNTNENNSQIVVSGRYVYATTFTSPARVVVIDISNPASPTRVGAVTLNTGESNAQIAVAGRYAYVSTWTAPAQLVVVDISNPTTPSRVSSMTFPTGENSALSIDVAGRYAYISTETLPGKVLVADVSNPSSPVRAGVLSFSGLENTAQAVAVAGRYAYAVTYTSPGNLIVVDITGFETTALMAHSAEVGGLQVRNSATIENNLSVRGGLTVGINGIFSQGSLSVRGGSVGAALSLLDIRNASGSSILLARDDGKVGIGTSAPSTMFEVQGTASASYGLFGAIQVAGFSSTSYSRFGTATTGHSLSAASDLLISGMLEVDGNAFFDNNASVSGTLEITKLGTSGDHFKLTDSANTKTYGLVVRDGDFLVRAPSISNAFSSRYVIASVASNSLGWTLGTPASPSLASSFATPQIALDVYVSGKYAYVAEDASGIQIIDISNPRAPVLMSTLDTSGTAIGIYVSGRYAYVGDSTAGLKIIDVTNPSAPILVGTYNTTGNAENIYVSGKYAYVTDNASGLEIIDISNPSNPTLAGNYDTPDLAEGIYVSGKYAYVGDNNTGLLIIDISNPSKPSLVGTYDTPSTALGIYVSGKYAYVAGDTSGLLIIDVSNPTTPTLTGSFDTVFAESVYVSGKYAYVADNSGGVKIVDVSNPSVPTLAGSYTFSTNVIDVYVSGKYVYVAGHAGGLKILDIGGLETHALYAGNINTNDITISENVDIGNSLYVRNGLNVGNGGLLVNGPIALSASFSANIASLSASDLFTVTHAKGRLSGDALQVDLAASTSQEFFTGNFANFTTAGTTRILFESSGSILASGAAQFGSAGAPSSVSYSRFGTANTSYSTILSSANDLLISGDLEVDGQALFDNYASVSGGVEITPKTDPTFNSGPVGAQLLLQNNAGVRGMYLGYDTAALAGYIGASRYGVSNQSLLLNPDGYLGAVGGNVGIGPKSPEQRLEVTGNIFASASGNVDLILRSSSTNGVSNNDDSKFMIRAGSASESLLVKNGSSTSLVTIASAGTFTVNQLSSDHGFIAAGTGNNKLTIRNTTAGTENLASFAILADNAATGANNQFFSTTYNSNGGSEIADSYRIISLGTGGLSLAASSSDGGVIRFYSGSFSAERARFDQIGRLGIGTTTPVQELHIASGSDGNIFRLQDSDGTCDQNPEAGVITTTCSSDIRLKDNIVDAAPILNRLMDIRIRDFTVKASGDRMTGVIAQELQQTWPDMVASGSDGLLMVHQPSIWQIIKSIQEQQAQISEIASKSSLADRSFLDAIVSLFEKVFGIVFKNGLVQSIKGVFGIVETDRLCVGNTCVTEKELIDLLQRANVPQAMPTVQPTPAPTPTNTPIPYVDPTPTPSATPTPITSETPTVSPVETLPTVSPSATPEPTPTPTPDLSPTPTSTPTPTPIISTPEPTPVASEPPIITPVEVIPSP